MTTIKRLIVTAEELGRTEEANRGVAGAHRRGIVTSATLMVNHPAAQDVPALSRENPNLGIGLQVELAAGTREGIVEARAQLRRFREIMGRDPTHLDTRHYAHRDRAAVLEALVTLAWECGRPLRAASHEVYRRLKHEGIPTTDRFADGFSGAAATLPVLLRVIAGIDAGTTELTCQPDGQLEVLTHPEVRQTIQAAGIRLIHFGQL